MSEPAAPDRQVAIAVLAPFGRDAQTLAAVIEHSGARAIIHADAEQLCASVNDDTSALLVTEEALAAAAALIEGCLQRQPAWSDIPVIILSGGHGRTGTRQRWEFLQRFGNVIVLERLMPAGALQIALRAANRARAWQYVVRDQMQQLSAQAQELERRVEERTRALQAETEQRKQAENALHEARRLETIGRLTGGVAHDFNNLLQVVNVSCTLLRHYLGNPARAEGVIATIERSAERGSRLTHQLLAFGRRQALTTETLDPAQQIRDMRPLLQQSVHERIALHLDLPAGLWPVDTDAGQLEMALLNLVINARDVLPAGGSITLAARNLELPAKSLPQAADLRGQFVCLTVSDTGPGMPEEVRIQAFEPFFTTKPAGAGSGLGLSQVYGFARQSGGFAWIDSSPNGTTVALVLPRSQSAAAPAMATAPQATAPSRLAGVKVLCVEDDDAVAEGAMMLLAEFGCVAQRARNADDALRQDLDQFDIVFSDVSMPGSLDGIGLARVIAARHPHLPVILASGYFVAPERLSGMRCSFLAKPYSANALQQMLLRCLEHAAAKTQLTDEDR